MPLADAGEVAALWEAVDDIEVRLGEMFAVVKGIMATLEDLVGTRTSAVPVETETERV